MKLNNIVSMAHYINGQGHTYTETVDNVETTEPLTADQWWRDCDDPKSWERENEWIEIRVETYAKDANPSIDDPVTKSEYVPD